MPPLTLLVPGRLFADVFGLSATTCDLFTRHVRGARVFSIPNLGCPARRLLGKCWLNEGHVGCALRGLGGWGVNKAKKKVRAQGNQRERVETNYFLDSEAKKGREKD